MGCVLVLESLVRSSFIIGWFRVCSKVFMFSLSLCFLKVSWRHMAVGLSSAINRSSSS